MRKLSRRSALSMMAMAYPTGVAMARELKASGNTILEAATVRKLMPRLGPRSQDRLLRILNNPSERGKIPAADVGSILEWDHRTVDDFMVDLLPIVQTYSFSPLSRYRVGAVVRGTSGSLYLGTNIEVPGQILGFAVHGEQCAVANAFTHGEGGLTSLAVTAAPCGHCRQFLNELSNSADLKIVVKGKAPTTLGALLPASFGPSDLKVTERLFKGKKVDLRLTMPSSDELGGLALEAASRAYAPYTKALSGVALISSSGASYQGSYIESAAYNPSLSPMQTALACLILSSERPSHITSVVLVELENASISQWSATQAVVESLAPDARVRRLTARQKP